MSSLELKVPPPAVTLLVAVAMWCTSLVAPVAGAPAARIAAAVFVVVLGATFSLLGGAAFRRAKTTVNPMRPESASSLVVTGVYRITRNPMYVGWLLLLVAWAVFLWSAWAVLGPVVFALYVSRFQIAPEERALTALFGREYLAYKAKVRPWL
jgi:protein-S-isoprenylcysteine O-methyltransferase Ste14